MLDHITPASMRHFVVTAPLLYIGLIHTTYTTLKRLRALEAEAHRQELATQALHLEVTRLAVSSAGAPVVPGSAEPAQQSAQETPQSVAVGPPLDLAG